MNEELKAFSIKLLLTIPAIMIGLFSALMFIFKPLIELWFPGKFEFEPPKKVTQQSAIPAPISVQPTEQPPVTGNYI